MLEAFFVHVEKYSNYCNVQQKLRYFQLNIRSLTLNICCEVLNDAELVINYYYFSNQICREEKYTMETQVVCEELP